MKIFVLVVSFVGTLVSFVVLLHLLITSLAIHDLHVALTLLVLALFIFFGIILLNWPAMEL